MNTDLRISFNTTNYDPFIDALKGFSIIFVIINHSIPQSLRDCILFDLWGGMAVPLFFLIQVFHYFKRGIDHCKAIRYDRIVKRILLPFVIAEALIFVTKSCFYSDISGTIRDFLEEGGLGPGTYYVWIYLQFVFLLPLCRIVIKRANSIYLSFVFIAVSIILEVVCVLLHVNESTYKFLFVRYFFLLYLGYIWAKEGVLINKQTVALSILGIVAILMFDYTDINLSPLFYPSTSWRAFHWISYFYVSFGFVFILHLVFRIIGLPLKHWLCLLGHYSWEIFCTQLVVFSLISPKLLTISHFSVINGAIYFCVVLSLSLFPPLIISFLLNNARQK